MRSDVKPTRAFDPRDPAQVINDPSTWKLTSNIALVVVYLTRLHFVVRSVEVPVVAVTADQSGEYAEMRH